MEVRKKSRRQIEEEEEEEQEALRRKRALMQERHDRVHRGDGGAQAGEKKDERKRIHRS
ncbi:hypothetical protein [Methanocella sp. MCL-LM]|uniref:hypothetical protein n=1 Tax=Methanocella sp. MCL-LM TaxID=3412035 RepID=UPI003C71EE3C